MRAVNLSGIQFGRWTVLHRSAKSKRKTNYWRARCNCGREKIVSGSHLTTGASKSCGCVTVERVKKPFGVSAKNSLLKHYKHHALTRKLPWLISTDSFFVMTQMPCHYCGVEPANRITTPGGFFVYNGVDRVDSSKGYEDSNVVPCCEICNRCKSDRNYQSFVDWILRAADYIRSEGENSSFYPSLRLFRNEGEGLENSLGKVIEALRGIA